MFGSRFLQCFRMSWTDATEECPLIASSTACEDEQVLAGMASVRIRQYCASSNGA